MDTLFNFFIGNSFRGSGLELVRARAFIIFCSLLIGLFAANIFLYSVILEVSEYSKKFNLLINLALILVFFSSLMTIRFTGHLLLPANFTIFWVGFILCVLSYLNGGPANSFLIWLCWIPAMASFVFAGRKSGIFWCVAMLIFYSCMLTLYMNDYQFAQVLEKERLRPGIFSSWYVGFIAIIVIAFCANQMLLTLDTYREGNFDLIHQHIKATKSQRNIPYDLTENYLYNAIQRNKKYADKLALVLVSLQIETKDDELIDAINHETINRLNKFIRSTDLAIQLSNGYFVIIIESLSSTESAAIIKDALSRIFYRPYTPLSTEKVRVTPHMTSHLYPEDGVNIEDISALLRRRIKP